MSTRHHREIAFAGGRLAGRRLGMALIGASLAWSVALTTGAASQTAVPTPSLAAQPLRTDPATYQEFLDQRGITGYASAISARPGDTVEIMVSTKSPTFTAELVRIIHGDADPRGPGIKEEVIASPANGVHDGTYQVLPIGSYVTVPEHAALDLTSDFTITAWISPTTIPGSKLNPAAHQRTPAGTPRPQGIVAKWDDDTSSGYGLFVDDDGSLALWLGAPGRKVVKVRTGVAMHPNNPGYALGDFSQNHLRVPTNFTTWYFVAASYDARTGEARLYQQPLKGLPNPTRKLVVQNTGLRGLAANDVPLLIGAGWAEVQPGGSEKGGLFNGKIDGPRIYARALTPPEVEAVRTGTSAVAGAIAAWDFARQPGTTDVIDVAGGHNGRSANNPVRAVTGHNWKHGFMDFRRDPDMYNAIYFHEDDLGDPRWKPTVRFTIPDDAKSGFYAARLKAGDNVFHAMFTVLPRQGSHADVAFLVPTLSYTAYGSTGARNYSHSQYSVHSDGSAVVNTSLYRPMVDMRPYASSVPGYRDGRPWQFEADTHITDWLEQSGHAVDYITDLDVHRQGAALLKNYKVVITGTHPEYVSEQMWHGIEEWLNGGGRLMYMGGNGFYWVTSLDAEARYQELRRHDGTNANSSHPGEYYHATTGEFGGLWRFRGYAPQELVGVGFTAQGFANERSRPYRVTEQGHGEGGAWIFAGVNVDGPIGEGPSLVFQGGAAGEEVDRAEYSLGTPVTTLVVATATEFDDMYHHVVEEVNSSNDRQGGMKNQLVRADMTLMYYPNGGAVWSSSSIAWAGSLFANNYNNDVARITKNVLDMFASGKPLPAAPAAD